MTGLLKKPHQKNLKDIVFRKLSNSLKEILTSPVGGATSGDSKKAQNTTGIRSGPGYRVWTNAGLSGCFTKLVLRWFSCAADILQNIFLSFSLKTQLFLKTKLFFQN